MQMSRFINTELKSDSDSELDSEEESKFDTELMTKLESGPDSEQIILFLIIFTLNHFYSYIFVDFEHVFSSNINEVIKAI